MTKPLCFFPDTRLFHLSCTKAYDTMNTGTATKEKEQMHLQHNCINFSTSLPGLHLAQYPYTVISASF